MNLHGQPNRDAASPAAVRGRDPLDPRVLDWLVDGELSAVELQLVVKALENAPAGWRSCGLAFLEAQAFKQSFGGDVFLTRDDEAVPASPHGSAALPALAAVPSSAVDARGTPSGETTSTPPGEAVSPATDEARSASERSTERRRLRAWLESTSWVGLAATVFLSFSVGTWAGPKAARWLAPPEGPAPTTGGAPQIPSVPVPSAPGGGLEFVNVRAPGADGAERTIRVPVVDTPSLQEAWKQDQPADDAYRAQLEAQGHAVQEQQILVPVTLPDGRTILYPVQQLRVRPAEPKEWQ